VLGGEVARKILKGEALDGSDFARMAVASERAGIKIAEKIFGDSAVLKSIKSGFAAAPIVGEAFAAVSSAFGVASQEKEDAQAYGRRFGSGQIGQAEFEYFQKLNDRLFFFGSPRQATELVGKAADAIATLSKEQIQSALDKTKDNLPSELKGLSLGSDLSANALLAAISASRKEKEKQLSHSLTSAQNAKVIRESVFKTFGNMPDIEREQLADALIEAAKKKKQSVSDPDKSAADMVREGDAEFKRKWFASHHRSYSPEIRNEFDDINFPRNGDIVATNHEREGYYAKLSADATKEFLSTYATLSMEHAGYKPD